MSERPETVPKVYAAVLEVMRTIGTVGKEGKAAADQGGYQYRKIDDVIDAVSPAMTAAGLICVPNMTAWEELPYYGADQKQRLHWKRTKVTMLYRYTAVTDGSFVDVEVTALGDDNADKGTGKAASYCKKLAHCDLFQIPFGDPTIDLEHATNAEARQRDVRESREQAPRQSRRQQSSHPDRPGHAWTAGKWEQEMRDRGVDLPAVNAWLATRHAEMVLTNVAQIVELPDELRVPLCAKVLKSPVREDKDPFDDAGSPSGDESDGPVDNGNPDSFPPDESAETSEEAAEMIASRRRGYSPDDAAADSARDTEGARD